MYKVQEVAKIAGVSVRTLHHYDSIGLMKPSNIGSNRYRYYNDEDLKLLQHVLFFKEIGFSLKKIQEIVAEGFNPEHALAQHAEFLLQKKERIEKLIENAEMTLRETQGQEALTNEQRFSAFASEKGAETINKYKAAVKQEAPKIAVAAGISEPLEENALIEGAVSLEEISPADGFVLVEELVSEDELARLEEMVAGEEASSLDESAEAAGLDALEETSLVEETSVEEPAFAEEASSVEEEIPAEEPKAAEEKAPEKEKEDLEEINREGNRIYTAVAELMDLPPANEAVQKEMEAYYILLNRFYNCNPKMFRGLGDLYAKDSRFSNNIDQHGQGLSKYLKDAMYIYAEGVENA